MNRRCRAPTSGWRAWRSTPCWCSSTSRNCSPPARRPRCPAARVSAAGSADDTGAVTPQGPVWIGKDFRLDRTPRAPSEGTTGWKQQRHHSPAPLAPRPLAHRAAWREASEPAGAEVPAGVRGARLSTSTRTRPTPQIEKTRRGCRRATASEHLHPSLGAEHPLLIGGQDQRLLSGHVVRLAEM